MPGQILVGKFDTVMRDDVTGEEERIDSLDFVDRARAAAPAQWAQPGRPEVEEIACYLTGRRDQRGLWGISEFTIADKHGSASPRLQRQDQHPPPQWQPDLPGARGRPAPAAHRITADTGFFNADLI